MIQQLEKLPSQNIRLQVAVYYRMSTDLQDTSIEQQRKEVRKYIAGKGYVIFEGAEYQDEGKSGSGILKRPAFRRMIADSANGNWSAIICYDTSRFGRMDTIDSGEHKKILRSNGVHLETVREGKIDWNTSLGRIQDTIISEGNHEYIRKLAAGVVRGKNNSLESGYWPHGRVPYGYSRQYFSCGEPKHIDKRTEKSTRPKGWKAKLVIDPVESKLIAKLFKDYDSKNTSCRSIATALNSAGVTPPKGKMWYLGMVTRIIGNPAYKGDATIGIYKGGKKGKFEQAEAQTVTSIPPIVSPELWQRCQEKRKLDKEQYRKVQPDRAGTLSGLMLCGHCGHRLVKKIKNEQTYYVCASPSLRPHLNCKQRRIREEVILPHVIKTLVESVDFELLAAAKAKPPEENKSDAVEIQKRIKLLEKEVTKGQQNLLLADAEDFAAMQGMLRAKRDELGKLQNTLNLAVIPAGEGEKYLKWWNGVKDRIISLVPEMSLSYPAMVDGSFGILNHCIQEGIDTEPDTLRALLHRLNLKITLWWIPRGDRYFTLERGLITADFGQSDIENFVDTRETYKVHKVLVPIRIKFEKVIDFSGVICRLHSITKDPQATVERSTRYREKHPERVKATYAKWFEKNREAIRLRSSANYYKRKARKAERV